MGIDACIRRIDRHLAKENVQPLIVDVQNREDLSELVTHFDVSGNAVIAASDYCKPDEYPQMAALWNDLSVKTGRLIVTGLTAFLKLKGEQYLRDTLKEILDMSTAGNVVVITYQCKNYLEYSDPRRRNRVCIFDGTRDDAQLLVFVSKGLDSPHEKVEISGINNIGNAIERETAQKIFVKTKMRRHDFPYSLYPITDLNSAYDILTLRDGSTRALKKECGTDGQWNYALSKFSEKKSWADIIDSEFGNRLALDIAFANYSIFDENRKWLYFVGLKLFGAVNNRCLNEAAGKAAARSELAKQIYRSIMDISYNDPEFESAYKERKALIAQLGNPSEEVDDYCRLVQGKGKSAIYYLTDNTQKEKELIFRLLDRYADEYTKAEVLSALRLVYPALSRYLADYRFKNDLLDSYFRDYKYQKVINRILPEFEKVVEEQAQKREYNLILEPRSAKIESIDRTGAQLYFVDAMGVEYLSYIMSLCGELKLMANVSVCCCELPSITSQNKEFLELFENGNMPIVSIKDIDDIKHHGKYNYDYEFEKTPIHLIRELDVIQEMLEKIKDKLSDGKIKKAIIVADHGASRLAVIHGTESVLEIPAAKGHSGRCCLKTDTDVQPDFAADAGEFWALANYDRFKGSRKSNFEVHGGATLEEVTVPIIELTYISGEIEVYLMPVNSESISIEKIPEVIYTRRNGVNVKIYATAILQDVSVSVDGKTYDAEDIGNGFHTVNIPDIKKSGLYTLNVYAGGNIVAEGLKFKANSATGGFQKMGL